MSKGGIIRSCSQLAVITIEAAFRTEGWLPLKLLLTSGNIPLQKDTLLKDFITPDTLTYTYRVTHKLKEVSLLLEQEAVVQEKYDLPHKLLTDITKKVKQQIATPTILIPADLHDDYSLPVASLLEKVYSKKEVKDMLV